MNRLLQGATVAPMLAVFALVLASCAGASGTDRSTLSEPDPTPTPLALAPTTAVNLADIRVDGFDEDGAFPQVATKLPLVAETGTWLISDGRVATADIPQLVPFNLVANAGSGEGLRQVTMPVTASGAGLSFRFADARNYWRITAAPSFATWTIAKVIDGDEVALGDLGLVPADDGTTVGVLLEDDRIVVLVNGAVARDLSDPDLQDAPGVGMFATGGQAALARWDDMVVVAVEYERPDPTPTPRLELEFPTPAPADPDNFLLDGTAQTLPTVDATPTPTSTG